MKKVCFALPMLVASSLTLADSEKQMYFEFGLGQSSADVSTKTYSGTTGGVTYNNFRADLDYEDATTYGFEIGANNFLGTPLRVGFSLAQMDLNFEKATGSGTIATSQGTVNLSGSATAADVRGIGLSFDNEVKVYTVNAYYDFDSNGNLSPYVGVGFGLTDVENAKDDEFTTALHLGFNYDLGNDMYIGGKYTRLSISGITDKLGVEYSSTDVNYMGLTLGVNF